MKSPKRIWIAKYFLPVNRYSWNVGTTKESAELLSDTKAREYIRVDTKLTECEYEELAELLEGSNPVFRERILSAVIWDDEKLS